MIDLGHCGVWAHRCDKCFVSHRGKVLAIFHPIFAVITIFWNVYKFFRGLPIYSTALNRLLKHFVKLFIIKIYWNKNPKIQIVPKIYTPEILKLINEICRSLSRNNYYFLMVLPTLKLETNNLILKLWHSRNTNIPISHSTSQYEAWTGEELPYLTLPGQVPNCVTSSTISAGMRTNTLLSNTCGLTVRSFN